VTLPFEIGSRPSRASTRAGGPGDPLLSQPSSSGRREAERSPPSRQPKRRILPELMSHLPALGPLFDGLAEEAALEIENALEWMKLSPRAVLFKEGDAAADAFVLTAGQLAIVLGDGAERRTIAHIHPGELVGEMGLLADAPRSATVIALRESHLIRLPRGAVDLLMSNGPETRQFLFRILTARLRQTSRDPSPIERTAERIAIVALGPVDRFKDALDWLSRKVSPVLVGSSKEDEQWGASAEPPDGPIIYMADHHASAWAKRCIDETDRVIFVAHAGAEPVGLDAIASAARLHREMSLILINRADAALPSGAAAWMSHFEPSHILHVRSGDTADYERVLRLLSRSSVCVVFSGGGARALAHIDVLQALEEKGIPIDAVAGTSMGALIGTLAAQGLKAGEIHERMRRYLVEGNSMGAYTIPFVSLISGRKLTRMFKDACEDAQVEDLWKTFFCVSTDLATGTAFVHRSGLLSRALRASSAIPGLFPPVLGGGQVLVDGFLVDNMPTASMRSLNRGTVIGIDVASDCHMETYDAAIEEKSWWWFLLHGRGHAPTMARVLMSSSAAASRAQNDLARAATDVLIEPVLDGVNLLSFKALDKAVEAGYRAAQEAFKGASFPPRFQTSAGFPSGIA
jgi:NTE family protein